LFAFFFLNIFIFCPYRAAKRVPFPVLLGPTTINISLSCRFIESTYLNKNSIASCKNCIDSPRLKVLIGNSFLSASVFYMSQHCLKSIGYTLQSILISSGNLIESFFSSLGSFSTTTSGSGSTGSSNLVSIV